jgi:Uma2 family endonuclease
MDELLAMPEDGMDRELIRGELREKPMTRRNRKHSRAEGKLAFFLHQWLAEQPSPRGEILDGEAGFRIRREPDTGVGIDLAYISPELSAVTPEDAVYVDGVPLLAVEILSPSDTLEGILDKVQEYLSVGVAQVWLVEPRFRTVMVYRSGAEPQLFNAHTELAGDPELPGFRIKVADIFSK